MYVASAMNAARMMRIVPRCRAPPESVKPGQARMAQRCGSGLAKPAIAPDVDADSTCVRMTSVTAARNTTLLRWRRERLTGFRRPD